MTNHTKYKMVDLFAGCGGLSLGLEQAGFTPWFVNEIVETFCNTYKKNHELSDDHYYVGDINELNSNIEKYAYFWTATENINDSYFYQFFYWNTFAKLQMRVKNFSHSLRCIKD